MIASIIVSFVMIALSAFSIISSVIAAILHNVGAFIVLINSARIRK
jgi:cation transport ATPase